MNKFRIEIEADDRVQLATHHLARAILRSVRVYNESDSPVTNLKLSISVDPEVAVSKEVRLDSLAAGAAFEVPEDQLGLALKSDRLANQLERQRGHVEVALTHEGQRLAVETAPLEILAYNEWIGLASPPEMLAAFVTPNHPGVAKYLDAARSILQSQGLDTALEGYQSRDPNRIAELAKAIYLAVRALGIGYANPPASFEAIGQKVRTVEQVLSERLGTCLDLTLIMAAALEQIGLHPLVILEYGHAYPAVWLTEWSLPTPWIDDPSAIRKRIDLGECLAFDSSAAASGAPFNEAVDLAERKLQRAEPFRFALDVHTARRSGVGPMGLLREGQYVAVQRPTAVVADGPLAQIKRHAPLDAPDTPAGRIERWKSKLLDLTLRNRLLNHRDSKVTLPLLGTMPADVEDALENHGKLTLLPRHAPLDGDDANRLAVGELGHKRLVVNLPRGDFEKRAVELYRRNRQMLEDSGASALFLSLGMLKWFESPSSAQERLAPILLVPVTLERTAVGGPYHLVRSEDDTIVNSTLLKKLEADFGIKIPGLGTNMAMDEWGVDVERNLTAVRTAVKDQPRFEVVSSAGIAFYDFQKFMMWLDLEQNAQSLMQSEIVRHIVEGSDESFPVVTSLPNPDDVDKRPVRDDLSLVDSDSSQVAAVFSALEGNSFVLQGPPGTGKSQTITNLISQALGRGKSVLFVSEKRAALEVVQSRLKGVGLGPFTLDVHSDRASKADVVGQLEEPLKFAWEKSSGDWAATADELSGLRTRLNSHVEKMHEAGPFGESLYQAVSRLIQLDAQDAPRVTLSFSPIPDISRYQSLRESVAALATQTKRTGHPARHPWKECLYDDWTTSWQNEVRQAVDDAFLAGERWRAARDAAVALVLPGESAAPEVFDFLGDAADLLADAPEVRTEILREPKASVDALVERADRHLQARATALTAVSSVFDLRLVREVDVEAERRRFAAWSKAFVLFALVMLFFARRRLKAYASGPLPSNDDVLARLEAANAVRAEDAELSSIGAELAKLFGPAWKGEATSPRELVRIWEWAASFRELLAAIRELDERAAERVLALATNAESRGPRTKTGGTLEALRTTAGPWRERSEIVARVLRLGPSWGAASGDARIQRLAIWRESPEALRDWCDWLRRARAVESKDLSVLVSELRAERLAAEDLLPAFERAVRERWWEKRCEDDWELRRFRGRDHDEAIRRFRELDEQAKEIARREIQARVAARLPDRNAPGEMEVLRKEFSKQRRHKPVRKLFAEVPNTLLRLKPCVLMSPLSVARFLDPSLALFDVVVFDEASQIPPWDAIGAISRGKQAIIVGDSRQLPPTAFFSRDDSEDDVDDEDAVELESILEQAVVRGVPQMTLNWHYRSRHESLISFSNQHYYDNRLHVFPSPHHQSPQLGLKWIEVPEGYYDRGGTRTNRAEAQRVVAEIVRRLEDPVLSQKSIGVVTFSQAQQKEVEDLLDASRREKPQIETFFVRDHEPVFVKNLENVQGDERDIMLFSIGYGPDQHGRVTMAFGPLNRAGGERRLNVAVTRARELLLVFSTLRSDQIDLSRTNALGVKHLKTFLDYAARGKQALLEAVTLDSTRGFDSPFEEQVYDALSASGWTVHKQVGVGGFFIDLAVVDPDRPGAYLLGIECDGAAYHSARSARDRDRIRQNILESLGWNIHRIWSTDWWIQRTGEAARLEQALARAQFEEKKAVHLKHAFRGGFDHILPARVEPEDETTGTTAEWPEYAVPWSAPAILPAREQAEFYAPHQAVNIIAQIEQVVGECAPIPLGALARHIAAAWGFSSTTQKLRERVLELGRKSQRCYIDSEVFWQSPAQRKSWRGFRYPGAERHITDVPPVEIEWCANWIVARAISLDRDTLVAEVLKAFGHSRVGKNIREPVDDVIERLIASGALRDELGKISGSN